MVLDFAKEAIQNTATHSINFDELRAGKASIKGVGAGGKPQIGREAAKEAIVELKKVVSGADMVFILAGLGGGTGTGAAPGIAHLAKETGAVVIGVVTMPFEAEKA